MNKIKLFIAALVLVLLVPSTVSARSVSHSSVSHSTSHPSTYHPTPHVSSSGPKAWSSTTKYGTGKGKLTGTGKLKSKTKPPKAHDYKGKKYNSSEAIYTNKRGNWVYYWLPIANGGVACYDKDHKQVTCDRDKKSYSKDW
jgi:hypothetical protein